ncbi:MAG TPA: transglycosylase family protein [Acidimicrobiales bacterium]|nr:transglycosylase family protein [Acidimicrobiales bacterium]
MRATRRRLAALSVGAAGVTALGVLPAHASAPPTPDNFHKLRVCESSDNYSTNTGNGYYGAYQFSQSTWNSLGFSGRPDQASPATQDQAARDLYNQRGWEPWPACSHKEGLD